MSTLEQWRFEADGGDWDDVVRRARRRLPLGRAALAVAAALVVAGPALGLVARNALDRPPKRPGLIAELTGPGGVHGTFTAFSPWFRIVQHGGRRLPAIIRAHKRPVVVMVSIRVPGRLTSVRIRKTTVVACHPCVRTHYALFAKPRVAARLFLGGPTVTVTAGGKTFRGTLR